MEWSAGARGVSRPTLVLVSGPPGSGKTTLAHTLAAAIPCPAICRDEIKEGMVHAHGGGFQAAAGDELTLRTLPLFFDVLRLLLVGGVTVVAEAAFQDRIWRPGLEPLLDLAQLRVVNCHVPASVSYDRARARGDVRAAHEDSAGHIGEEGWTRRVSAFERISIRAAAIDVDTTSGYNPEIVELLDFVNRPG